MATPTPTLIGCPLEVKIMIFKALQAITSGPRYQIRPKNFAGETADERDCKVFREGKPMPRRFKVQHKDLDTGSSHGRRKYKGDVYRWSRGYDYRLCWELVDPGIL